MANRHPNALKESVVVPGTLQTGVVSLVSKTACEVAADPDKAEWKGGPTDVYRLTWKEHRRPEGSAFIYKAKAWVGFDGKRRLRIQKHHVYKGRVGRRVVILMRVNGRTLGGG